MVAPIVCARVLTIRITAIGCSMCSLKCRHIRPASGFRSVRSAMSVVDRLNRHASIRLHMKETDRAIVTVKMKGIMMLFPVLNF